MRYLDRYIDGQYRRPSGPVGRWIGGKMAVQHRPENLWTVDCLDVQPADRILEVGFGPGLAVQEVVRRLTTGQLAGVDFSRTMVSAARRRNAAAVRAGRADLRFGEAASLPFTDAAFDKAYSIHSIYFWPDPLSGLRELARVLRPGGLLVLTVLPRERWGGGDRDAVIGTTACKPYTGAELVKMTVQVGFSMANIAADSSPEHVSDRSNYSVMAFR